MPTAYGAEVHQAFIDVAGKHDRIVGGSQPQRLTGVSNSTPPSGQGSIGIPVEPPPCGPRRSLTYFFSPAGSGERQSAAR